VSVPLPTASKNQNGETEPSEDPSVDQAKHEAAEIIAQARRQAEAIIAESRSNGGDPSPLAALGDNAEEIVGQVRKLIKKQRQLQDERQEMEEEIRALQAERDDLVQRLTNAVERMEELSQMADAAQPASLDPPPPPRADKEPTPEAASLAERLEAAEREEREQAARRRDADAESEGPPPRALRDLTENPDDGADARFLLGSDGRSFYSRHSAGLPRLEGDGGRSTLSVMGDMRPDPDPRARKSRRRKKNA
jgi:hypothetical protein